MFACVGDYEIFFGYIWVCIGVYGELVLKQQDGSINEKIDVIVVCWMFYRICICGRFV